jgi:hypothetical protein
MSGIPTSSRISRNISNTVVSASGASPIPLSITRMVALASSAVASSRIRPPVGRFVMACEMRAASTCSQTGASGTEMPGKVRAERRPDERPAAE